MTLSLHQVYLASPGTAPTIQGTPPPAGTITILHRRRTANGNFTAVSPALIDQSFPITVVPEPYQGIGLVEDDIIVSDDDITFYRIPRIGQLTGFLTIPSFDPGSWIVLPGLNESQPQDFTGQSVSVRVTSPQLLTLFIRNGDESATLSDLVLDIKDPATGLRQALLAGLVTFDLFGVFESTGDGTLSGLTGQFVWNVLQNSFNTLQTMLAPGQVAHLSISIQSVAGGSVTGSAPFQIDVASNLSLVPISIAPGFPVGTLLVSFDAGTQLPFLTNGPTSGTVDLARTLVNIGGGSAAINRATRIVTLADGSYQLYVTRTGDYIFADGAENLPVAATLLATFNMTAGIIANLSIEIGLASGHTLDVPTSAATAIGQVLKAVDLTGTLDSVVTAAAGERGIGIVNRSSEALGTALLTVSGRAWGIASAAIAIGDLLSPTASGELKVQAGAEQGIATALDAAVAGELFEVLAHV